MYTSTQVRVYPYGSVYLFSSPLFLFSRRRVHNLAGSPQYACPGLGTLEDGAAHEPLVARLWVVVGGSRPRLP